MAGKVIFVQWVDPGMIPKRCALERLVKAALTITYTKGKLPDSLIRRFPS